MFLALWLCIRGGSNGTADCLSIEPRFATPTSDELRDAWNNVTSRLTGLLQVKGADAGAALYSVTSCGPRMFNNRVSEQDLDSQGRLQLPSPDALLIYVYADPSTYTCSFPGSNVVAYSSMCMMNDKGRPVLGYINLCLEMRGRQSALEQVLTHELLHVLGFNPDVLALAFPSTYRQYNSAGDPALVAAWAQQHYDCDNVNGAESVFRHGFPLSEDGMHMRPDLVGNDIMVPCLPIYTAAGLNIVTGSLAVVLQSLGHYDVDYAFVDTQWFGFRKGCCFVADLCESVVSQYDDEDIQCTSSCDDDCPSLLALPLTHDAALYLSILGQGPSSSSYRQRHADDDDDHDHWTWDISSVWFLWGAFLVTACACFLCSFDNNNYPGSGLIIIIPAAALLILVAVYTLDTITIISLSVLVLLLSLAFVGVLLFWYSYY